MLETLQFNRAATAEIVGLPETTLKGWLDKGLFREKSRGRGHHITFDLRDMMGLAFIKTLSDHGFPVTDAILLVNNHSVFGPLRDGSNHGEFVITKTPYGWRACHGTGDRLRVSVMLRPLHDEIIARLIGHIIRNPGADPARDSTYITQYLNAFKALHPDFDITSEAINTPPATSPDEAADGE